MTGPAAKVGPPVTVGWVVGTSVSTRRTKLNGRTTGPLAPSRRRPSETLALSTCCPAPPAATGGAASIAARAVGGPASGWAEALEVFGRNCASKSVQAPIGALDGFV